MNTLLRRLRPQPLRNWTLRARITTSLLGLLIVMCIAIGTFTELALRHSLMNRLDAQLTAQGGRQGNADRGFRGTGSGDLGPAPQTFTCGQLNQSFVLPPGSEVNAIGARACADGSTAGVILQQGSGFVLTRTPLSTGAISTLLSVPSDSGPHSVTVPGLGEYRVISSKDTAGDVTISGLPMKSVRDTLVNLTAVITAVTLLGLVIAGLIAALIVRLALRPLRRVTSTASRVAEMPLDQGEVALAERVPDANPHTEVGQVGVALNRMIENVNEALNARHHSETRVRQFVADASHELRTPLASIRGYAELTRRSRDAAPPDIAHAMTRVEAEASRMTRLVDDLLLLARLDAGRPLESEEVDLTRLTVDVLSDAHAAGPQHHWHLDVGEEPVVLTGDSPRLHQVLVNLLANARSHTPAGTNVWVRLSEQPGTATSAAAAIIEVSDDGPGIPPHLMPDIFERFSRGEQSRSRAAGSTGLGLAIVGAVVAAHGGHIQATSQPGRTSFLVTLPIHRDHQGDAQTPASSGAQALTV
ncbi:MAG: ATPase protein [Frankiales bacterium]|nr:ATPase protein [Frankiales bacterium]